MRLPKPDAATRKPNQPLLEPTPHSREAPDNQSRCTITVPNSDSPSKYVRTYCTRVLCMFRSHIEAQAASLRRACLIDRGSLIVLYMTRERVRLGVTRSPNRQTEQRAPGPGNRLTSCERMGKEGRSLKPPPSSTYYSFHHHSRQKRYPPPYYPSSQLMIGPFFGKKRQFHATFLGRQIEEENLSADITC